jgi:hypothetical protein
MPPRHWPGWSANWPTAKPRWPPTRSAARSSPPRWTMPTATCAQPNWRWPRRRPTRPGSRPNGASPMPSFRPPSSACRGLMPRPGGRPTLPPPAREGDPQAALAAAEQARDEAATALATARAALDGQQARKAELQTARDEAGSRSPRPAPNWPGSNANGRPWCATARPAPSRPRARPGPSRSMRSAPRRATNARWPPCWAAMPRLRSAPPRPMPMAGSGPAPPPPRRWPAAWPPMSPSARPN